MAYICTCICIHIQPFVLTFCHHLITSQLIFFLLCFPSVGAPCGGIINRLVSSIYQISRTSFFFYNIRKGGLKRRKGEGTKQGVCGGCRVGSGGTEVAMQNCMLQTAF